MNNPEISILLPCLNEEKSIAKCLDNILSVISNNSLNAEIVVIDNNSTDNTYNIVHKYREDNSNIKLFKENKRGYGFAYLCAIKNSIGKYIFMADGDGSYDFNDIPRFISKLKDGNDVVIGNRFSEKIEKGNMPFLHKYIGNPLLSFITRSFFGIKIKDIHCGARSITRNSLNKINLKTTGMEFASEMIIKSAKNNLKIAELPIKYHKRIGESKLRSFSDGWRHLRFILLYSPNVIFLIPGIIFLATGIISMSLLYFGNIYLFGVKIYFHPMFLSSLLTITGYELIFFMIFSRIYAVNYLNDKDNFIEKLTNFLSLEKTLITGALITLISILIYLSIFIGWIDSNMGDLNQTKNLIIALTLSVLGIQTIAGGLMLAIINIKRYEKEDSYIS